MAGNKPEEEGKQKKSQIIEKLLKYCEKEHRLEMKKEIYHSVSEDNWTIADLFIRQWLNNRGNGFGMKNVKNMYEYLQGCREELIEYNLLSKEGRNNSGFHLWSDYNF